MIFLNRNIRKEVYCLRNPFSCHSKFGLIWRFWQPLDNPCEKGTKCGDQVLSKNFDSPLVPWQFFHKFQSKVWFYSEMYFTIKKRIFASFWYQNIYVSNFTKLFRHRGFIQRHFLSYRTDRHQVNLPFTQTQISCVTYDSYYFYKT